MNQSGGQDGSRWLPSWAKYSVELDDALAEYADLKAQAAEFDPVELYEARLGIREEMERTAINRLKSVYGEGYIPMMLLGSKRDAANLLSEEAEAQPVREYLRRKQQAQQRQNKKKNRDSRER